jgi:hypothetical protein
MANPSKLWDDSRTEREFVESGLQCFTRTNDWGHRCGYVAVEKGHPLYGLDYDKIYDKYDIDVDGGITFAGGYDRYWILGWDAAHCWHMRDISIMSKELRKFYEERPELLSHEPNAILVDADMAEQETRRFARQVAQIG